MVYQCLYGLVAVLFLMGVEEERERGGGLERKEEVSPVSFSLIPRSTE